MYVLPSNKCDNCMQIVSVKDNDSSMFKWLNENTETTKCAINMQFHVCVFALIIGVWFTAIGKIKKVKNFTLLLAGL